MTKYCLLIGLIFTQILPAQSQKMRAEKAIIKANNCLQTQTQLFNSHFILLLFRQIEKNYPYHCPLVLDSVLQKAPVFLDDEKNILYYHRIAYKNQSLNWAKIDSLQGLEKLMLCAIHSDQKKIDTTFEKLLWHYAQPEQSIRNVAHIALVVDWLRENGQWEQVTQHEVLEKQLLARLSEQLELSPHLISDTEMEVALGLILLHQSQMIPSNWFAYLIDSQAENGGWTMNEQGMYDNIHQHPTVLAIWLLHIYLYPENKLDMLLR